MNNDYFKHFFDKKELEELFHFNDYEWLEFKAIKREANIEVLNEWVKRLCHFDNKYGEETIKLYQKNNLEQNSSTHQLKLLVKKK